MQDNLKTTKELKESVGMEECMKILYENNLTDNFINCFRYVAKMPVPWGNPTFHCVVSDDSFYVSFIDNNLPKMFSFPISALFSKQVKNDIDMYLLQQDLEKYEQTVVYYQNKLEIAQRQVKRVAHQINKMKGKQNG